MTGPTAAQRPIGHRGHPAGKDNGVPLRRILRLAPWGSCANASSTPCGGGCCRAWRRNGDCGWPAGSCPCPHPPRLPLDAGRRRRPDDADPRRARAGAPPGATRRPPRRASAAQPRPGHRRPRRRRRRLVPGPREVDPAHCGGRTGAGSCRGAGPAGRPGLARRRPPEGRRARARPAAARRTPPAPRRPGGPALVAGHRPQRQPGADPRVRLRGRVLDRRRTGTSSARARTRSPT